MPARSTLLSVFLLFMACYTNAVPIAYTRAQRIILLDSSSRNIEPEKYALVFEDKSGKMDFYQARDSISKFKVNKQSTINLGPTSSAVWCTFTVKNTSSDKWFIDVGEAYIDEIDVYTTDETGSVEHQATGLFRGYQSKAVKTNHYLVPLHVAPGDEKTIFIRAKSSTILKLPMTIGTLQTHYEANHKKDLIFGVYFGLILALSIYNFFVFVSIRDITYLYYVFYINFLGAANAWLRGYAPEFLDFISPKLNHGNIYASLAFMFIILFTNSFLSLKQRTPKLYLLGNIFLIINTFSFLANLLGFFQFGFFFILGGVIVALPYVTTAGIYSYLKGFKPAAFYLIGFGFFTLGDLIFMLNENGVLAQSALTHYSIQIGSALEAIILSFALANKLNSFKKEKELTQTLALEQANRFSKDLIDTQEAERKRIASELHDSVGQSLSLIKNKITLLMRKISKEQSLQELNDMVSGTIQEIRSISYGLRPFQLDILGLTQSIRSLVEDMADSSDMTLSGNIEEIDGLFSKDAEINIFRIIQEGLNNISKHSKATSARVEVMRQNEHIEIKIDDNGVGMNGSSDGSGLGLRGIRERVNILNGQLSISNNFPQGTSVKIQIGLHTEVLVSN